VGFQLGHFPGLVGVRGVQVWSHRPYDFMVLAFEPKASSHLFAATSFVSKYQVATEVLTAVSELNQEMTLLPCTREFLAHSRNVVSKWQRRDPLGEACPIQSGNCGMTYHALKLTAFTDAEIPPLTWHEIYSKFLAGYSGGFLNSQSPRDATTFIA
jgi:hypothetical protein